MAWLLDTNILSELRRPRPEPKVVAFIAAQPLEQLYISVVTLAELRFGIELVVEPSAAIFVAAADLERALGGGDNRRLYSDVSALTLTGRPKRGFVGRGHRWTSVHPSSLTSL